MESKSGSGEVTFAVLQARLLGTLRYRINNGEFTERGLARLMGISQPQIHNVLKGARKLSPKAADLFLSRLGITVLDLLTGVEVQQHRPGMLGPIIDGMSGAKIRSAEPVLGFDTGLSLRKPAMRDVSNYSSDKKRLG